MCAQSATRELIDTSFRKLRSAEGACELLQNFKRIKSKGAIQKQVINKFNDILEQVRVPHRVYALCVCVCMPQCRLVRFPHEACCSVAAVLWRTKAAHAVHA